MRKLKLLFYFSFFIFHFSFAQSWLWGKNGVGNLKSIYANISVAGDKFGNAYMGGEYNTTVIFYPDTLNYYYHNAFLVKYDSSGNVLWAKQPTAITSSSSFGYADATDTFRNIFTTGCFFDGNLAFGTDTLKVNTGIYNVFLAKYNSSGQVLWARQSTGNNNWYYQYDVAADIAGDAFITGYYEDTLKFGAYTLHSFYNTLDGMFLVKYDSAGNLLWATCSGGTGNIRGYGVAADSSGNSYVTGIFANTVSFGYDTLKSPGRQQIFLVKYDQGGNVLWANQTSGLVGWSLTVTTDISGNAYVSGYFADTLMFGSVTLIGSSTGYNFFIASYDANGNVRWAKQSLGNGGWQGTKLCSDANAHIYLTGSTDNPAGAFDTLIYDGHTLTTYGKYSASFLLEVDSWGNYICGSLLANGFGNSNSLSGCSADPSGKYIYQTGIQSSDSIYFDRDTIYSTREAPYIARWTGCGNNTETYASSTSSTPYLSLFPNPNNGQFTIQNVGVQNFVPTTIEIYNVLGEKVYTAASPQTSRNQFGIGSKGALMAVNIGNQPNGIYLYRVLQEDGSLIGEGKVIIEK
ncbi:MAG TPA: SBBP repeat-containing protein [Bacteroidia bacterium]|jgi:hypothetical protein|nr:SBBP repeat-containing protein [Bacteroidia bacterium]